MPSMTPAWPTPTSTAWSMFTMDSNTEVAVARATGIGELEILLEDSPRRWRGLRDGPAGGDRGGHRSRGLRLWHRAFNERRVCASDRFNCG